MSKFASTLKSKRESLGLSSDELAERLGISSEIVHAMEDGKFLPPFYFVSLLVKVLEDKEGALLDAYKADAKNSFCFG